MSIKNCFIIAPIGEAESDTRKRSDQILKHVISPALEKCGYKATRADQISEPGMITSQVIQHIVDDKLVLADLTERNPNVFYELAIRHAIRKPLVQLIKKGEQIPFDVAGTRTIHVDHHDLDSVESARSEIISQVTALEKNPNIVETPISVSLDLQVLRQSDNPEQRSLADVLSLISDLRNSIVDMQKTLESFDPQRKYTQYGEVYDTMPKKSERSDLTKKIMIRINELHTMISDKNVTAKNKDLYRAESDKLHDVLHTLFSNLDKV